MSAETPARSNLLCNKCKVVRDIDDFGFLKNGNRKKLCSRHEKPRPSIPERPIDNWDDFLSELEAWNDPDQEEILEVDKYFSMDSLPIDMDFDVSDLCRDIEPLLDIIWNKGGYRWIHRRTHAPTDAEGFPLVSLFYRCAQDQAGLHPEIDASERKRLVRRRDCFDCAGSLRLDVSMRKRTLSVKVNHHYHPPFLERLPTPEILNFINDRVASRTPQEIYQDLRASNLPGKRDCTEDQVYYRWKQANASSWKFDEDQLNSMRQLVQQHPKEYDFAIYRSGNLHGAAIFIKESLLTLRGATELSMGSTYGTNNQGAELYALLGELDGTGVPLAYMFKIRQRTEQRINGGQDEGETIFLLQQFLTNVENFGLDPTFIGSDKDAAELAAIKIVFPNCSLQLCQWHANRALKTKLSDSNRTKPQTHYRPGEVQTLVSGIEICWGSEPIRRPDGVHRYRQCDCTSKNENNEVAGRLEPDIKERTKW